MRKYKNVTETKKKNKDGKIISYYYHRITKKRILGTPGTPEFNASYKIADIRTPKVTTLADLIVKYQASREFTSTSDATKKDYTRYCNIIHARMGSIPIQALESKSVRRDILEMQNDYLDRPRAADYLISTLRRVLSVSIKMGYIKTNAAVSIDRLHATNRSDKLWTNESIKAFKAVAPVELQWAMDLALVTGQRQGDLLNLRWDAISENQIKIRQSKTKKLVNIPVTPMVQDVLDEIERRDDKILTMASGAPWRSDTFRTYWIKAAREAGIDDLHFHDLRGTFAFKLAKAGCTVPEIAAITGHSLKDASTILEYYIPAADEFGVSAFKKLAAAQST